MARLVITVSAVLLALGPAAQAKRLPSYSIKITTTYFGRTAEVWLVERGRIRVESFLPKKKIKLDRKLSPAEQKRLRAFTRRFPLGKLKTRYVAKVRGEGSTTYEIRVGKLRKKIYQYYRDQKDLTALWQELRAISSAKPR
jgi:hypothetical protein